MANYNYSNPTNRMRARKTLKAIYPLALEKKKLFDEGKFETSSSRMFNNSAQYLNEEKIAGIHIYSAPLGGWHADICLKDMPQGVPSIYGTPKINPCGSREEAVEAATNTLAMLLWYIETQNGLDTASKVALFEYDEVGIEIPQEVVDQLSEIGTLGSDYVKRRLDELRGELFFGEPLTKEMFEAFDQDTQLRVVSVFAVALHEGIFRWPESKDGHPDNFSNKTKN